MVADEVYFFQAGLNLALDVQIFSLIYVSLLIMIIEAERCKIVLMRSLSTYDVSHCLS